MRILPATLAVFVWLASGCAKPRPVAKVDPKPVLPAKNQERVAHVLVALCDNKYQGIQKVPKRIGNGDDPASNLYWGCDLGTYTYFRRHRDWQEIKLAEEPSKPILARPHFVIAAQAQSSSPTLTRAARSSGAPRIFSARRPGISSAQ